VSGVQFGPEIARRAADAHEHRVLSAGSSLSRPVQQRLPGISPGRRLEPWEQTQHQFTHDPRTWFHARIGDEEIEPPEDPKDGVHVGTLQAARDRIRHLTHDGVWKQPGFSSHTIYDVPRVFPVRITAPMRNAPTDPINDQPAGWHPHHNKYYRNQVEDPGSISAVVSRTQFLKTHREFVRDALAAHKPVPERVRHEYDHTEGRDGPHYDPTLAAPPTMPTDIEMRHTQGATIQRAGQSLWRSRVPQTPSDLAHHLGDVHGLDVGAAATKEQLARLHQRHHPEVHPKDLWEYGQKTPVRSGVDHTHEDLLDRDA